MDSVGKHSSGPKLSCFIGNNFRNDFFFRNRIELIPEEAKRHTPVNVDKIQHSEELDLLGIQSKSI
jgi:hypothetical protein